MGPTIERIAFESGAERTKARQEFWAVVNGGHGNRDWQQTSNYYWNRVKDLTDGTA